MRETGTIYKRKTYAPDLEDIAWIETTAHDFLNTLTNIEISNIEIPKLIRDAILLAEQPNHDQFEDQQSAMVTPILKQTKSNHDKF